VERASRMNFCDRQPAVNGGAKPLRGKPRERGWNKAAKAQVFTFMMLTRRRPSGRAMAIDYCLGSRSLVFSEEEIDGPEPDTGRARLLPSRYCQWRCRLGRSLALPGAGHRGRRWLRHDYSALIQ
jgi:hypothetical protein